jgi:hypothetical protein
MAFRSFSISFFVALLSLFAFVPGFAHNLSFSEAVITFKDDPESSHSFRMEFRCDVDGQLAEVEPGHMTIEDFQRIAKWTPEQQREGLARVQADLEGFVSLIFDGARANPTFRFPEYISGMPMMPIGQNFEKHTRLVEITGEVPEGAKSFSFLVEGLGNSTLKLLREGQPEVIHAMAEGVASPAYPLVAPVVPPTVLETAGSYFYLGFDHILPAGIDHILFVLGLFLLCVKLKPLFWQITSFTIAHSVTLILAYFDIVRVPGPLTEAIVALSIAYVAVENLFTDKMHWWRPLVVFCFGLLHGLAFGGGLQEIGLPEGQFIVALLMFNIGVEVGHLCVVAAAFLCVGWFAKKSWYRKVVVFPVSGMIAAIALYWSFTRFWGIIFG